MSEPKPIAAVDALGVYAASFNRDLASVLFIHSPGRFKHEKVRNATRTMAVGILAHKLAELIRSAPEGDAKGHRTRLETLAADILAGRVDGAGPP